MRIFLALALCPAPLWAAAAALPPAAGTPGVMVMAHGGTPDWDAAIRRSVEPLAAAGTMELAFGMAAPEAMQEAVSRLESRGARRIVVVRLFISGESFLERTEQILGLKPGAPERAKTPRPAPVAVEHGAHGAGRHPGHAGGHSMELWRVESKSEFVLTRDGLMDSPRVSDILLGRVRALSRDPARESVLILAHGPGDEAENERWLAKLGARIEPIARGGGFRRVWATTLREDWPQARASAERRIRAFVETGSAAGDRVLVVPFRLFGFGPYAEVLSGLRYDSDGRGLLPDPAIAEWIRDSARAAAAERDWQDPLGGASAAPARPERE